MLALRITTFSMLIKCYYMQRNSCDQGGSNERELLRLSPCNIFSILILFIRLKTLNHIKLGRAVIFMEHILLAQPLLILPTILIWNKITFLASNLLDQRIVGFLQSVDRRKIKIQMKNQVLQGVNTTRIRFHERKAMALVRKICILLPPEDIRKP